MSLLRGGRPYALAAMGAVAVLIGAGVYVATRLATGTNPFTWKIAQNCTLALSMCVAGGVLVPHPQARAVGYVILGSGVAGGAMILLYSLGDLALALEWSIAFPLHWVSEVLWPLFVIPLLTLLPLVFPSGQLPGAAWQVARWIAVAGMLLLMAATATAEVIPSSGPDDPMLANPLFAPPFTDWLQVAGEWAALAAALGGLGALAVRVATGSRLVRQQIAMVATCLAVHLVILNAYSVIPPVLFQACALLLPLLLIASIFVAVLRYELYDLRRIISRFTVYATLTALLTSIFVAVYLVTLALAARLSGTSTPWSAAVVGAVAVVLCVEPMRSRLQGRLERKLLGERREPLRAMARLREATSEGDDRQVMSAITETVAQAVRAPGAAMLLHVRSTLEATATTGVIETCTVVPLHYRGERLGELHIAGRSPGEEFGAGDRALLDQLADQASAIVYGLRRDAELAAARREAISVAAEERARLGRDLHDGLAPLLAGAGLTAEALRRGFAPGSADELAAARLADRLRTAAGQVRRFAHDLQPVTPAGVGLETAVRDYVSTLHGPHVPSFDLRIGVPSLPPAVEQAAYFVVLEALTNVIRHAGASETVVTLECEDDRLTVQVRDNGVGFTGPYVSGMGLTSMRQRVQALEGTFHMTAQPAGGTLVRADLPVHASPE